MTDKKTDHLATNFECRTPHQNPPFIIREMMVAKANAGVLKIFLLAILAGVYIGFGCEISTLAAHDGVKFFGFGATKVLAGAVFSVGLMLVVITGGELFTGNVLIVGSVLDRKISGKELLKNWGLVYCANFIGSILLATIVFYSNSWQQNNYLVGAYALNIGVAKTNLPFLEAFAKGILCNWLVCLAIWMSAASKHVIGKIFAIFFPIMAFVALGYEHCIANMFFIPKAIMLTTQPEVVKAAHVSLAQLKNLNATGLINNLIPVTLGNIVSAALFIAFFYWAAFLKNESLAKR